ncbi:WD repeat-containing protein 43 isoform X1 [Punica granatum]|uniref:WD repeat-containing protein 43 isoform X1 n=2 Tax=Punica granatum TaxID=22663 RepID=A0A6P8BWJ3_PUNGR|nr:WD repeat-containing protein 43 isoform X1 [Punica granatum]
MGSSNIGDILTAFSPSLDFLAVSSGDGRIKIWDTVKGQIQTEFADITGSDETNPYIKSDRGHLSVDYTCMKWLAVDGKKKRKLGSSLLILGTGSGDVLALDVSAGQLKWRVSDCHPGGVSAISFSKQRSHIFTSGADGMICEIDFLTGNLVQKFRGSTKAISAMTISPDGRMVATAASQLKILSSTDHKKIQKFSGHPGAVRCMIFSDDGNYILSSAVGERYVAMWRVGGGKKQSADCILAMEHPAVSIDCRINQSSEIDNRGLYVLAISVTGVCYFWCAKDIEELRNAVPTKISLSNEENLSSKTRAITSTIFAAKLQGIASASSGQIFVAFGLLVKPLFQKILVSSGENVKLRSSSDGVLLPMSQSLTLSKKARDVDNKVSALDRANAEDALLPIPKLVEFNERDKTQWHLALDPDEVIADLVKSRSEAKSEESQVEVTTKPISMEDQLRSLGILDGDSLTSKSRVDSSAFKRIDFDANLSPKKMRAAILSMTPTEAYGLLETLIADWQSRSRSAKAVLPWINCILINHSYHVIAQEEVTQMLHYLSKMVKARGAALQPLLQLVGRLQLILEQVNKTTQNGAQDPVQTDQINGSDSEDNDDDDDEVDDMYYGQEEDESQLSTDNDEEE